MKRILLSCFCVLVSAIASAQSLDYIVVQKADGQRIGLPAVGLKITFGNQKMHAVSGARQVEVPLADLANMFFSADATAIDKVVAQDETVSIVDGRLRVNAPAGAKVAVYTLDGRRVSGDFFPHGIYLVKVNGRTYKLMAK